MVEYRRALKGLYGENQSREYSEHEGCELTFHCHLLSLQQHRCPAAVLRASPAGSSSSELPSASSPRELDSIFHKFSALRACPNRLVSQHCERKTNLAWDLWVFLNFTAELSWPVQGKARYDMSMLSIATLSVAAWLFPAPSPAGSWLFFHILTSSLLRGYRVSPPSPSNIALFPSAFIHFRRKKIQDMVVGPVK